MPKQLEVKVLGIIPARGGSKSIPYKNIVLFRGKPLIYHTIKAAKAAKLLDAVIVSTDDEKIAAVARSFGADVPFLRPKRFAGDKSPDLEFLQHALWWLEKNRGWRPEIVVVLRPTAPTRRSADIDKVIRIIQNTGCDSVRTVTMPDKNPFKMWYFSGKDGSVLRPFAPTKHYSKWGTDVPRQALPKVFWQNAMVDATRAKFIKKGRVYGRDIRGVVVDSERAIDIDTYQDLKAVKRK
ncbi:MAG: acylneuraminate cytidylyltransferase family protein [Candidatus Doudnabacteria bacterium]|nr:acylneuraminate cytidylyltransferase family protein [Candidatus Doudnabacteria bacterium]